MDHNELLANEIVFDAIKLNEKLNRPLENNKSVTVGAKDYEKGFRVVGGPINEDFGATPGEQRLEIRGDNGEALAEAVNFQVIPEADFTLKIRNPHKNRPITVWIYGEEHVVEGGNTIDLPMTKPDKYKDNPDIEDGAFYVTTGDKNSYDRAVKVTRKPLSNEIKIKNLSIDRSAGEPAQEASAPQATPEAKPAPVEKNSALVFVPNPEGIYPISGEDAEGRVDARITPAEGYGDFYLALPDGEFAWIKYQGDRVGGENGGNVNMRPGMYFRLRDRLFHYVGMNKDKTPHIIEVKKAGAK